MRKLLYVAAFLVLLALCVSRVFVVGELDNSFASHYKDWAHIVWGMGFAYAVYMTVKASRFDREWIARGDAWVQVGRDRDAAIAAVCLWLVLVAALVVEVVCALRDNHV